MKGKPRNTGRTVTLAEFRRMWEDLSISVAQIGQRLGISQQGVTQRAKSRGLPPRPKRGAKPACDPAKLRRLYDADLSMKDIAAGLGCDRKTVHNYCVRLNLARRGSGRRPKATIADFRAVHLREAMAASARETEAALRLSEMVDYHMGNKRRAA